MQTLDPKRANHARVRSTGTPTHHRRGHLSIPHPNERRRIAAEFKVRLTRDDTFQVRFANRTGEQIFTQCGRFLLIPLNSLGNAQSGYDNDRLLHWHRTQQDTGIPHEVETEIAQRSAEVLSLGAPYTTLTPLYIAPCSAVPNIALNDFTLAFLEVVEEHKAQLKGATIIDVGSGSGVLSALALQSGARQALLIENSREEQIAARILMNANGLSECAEYEITNRHLGEESLERYVRNFLSVSTAHAIGFANIGPWHFYHQANIDALRLLSSLPQVEMIVNGGYYFSSDPTYSGHKKAFALGEQILSDAYFNVSAKKAYWNVASDAHTGDQEGLGILVARR